MSDEKEIVIDLDNINIENTSLDKDMVKINKKSKTLKDDLKDVLHDSTTSKEINALTEVYKQQLIDNPYNNITLLQFKSICLFIEGKSKKEIACILNVSYSSIINWFENESVLSILDICRKEIKEASINALQNLLPKAVNELGKIINDPTENAKNKLSAIKVVLESSQVTNNTKTVVKSDKTIITIASPELPPIAKQDDIIDI